MAFGGLGAGDHHPVAMTFDHGQVKLGGSGRRSTSSRTAGRSRCSPPTSVPTPRRTVWAAVGDFTITIANFVFPPATSDVSGVPGETATFGLTPLANVTGHYDAATGVLTTNPSTYRSDVTLAGTIAAACEVTPITLAFSTAKPDAVLRRCVRRCEQPARQWRHRRQLVDAADTVRHHPGRRQRTCARS